MFEFTVFVFLSTPGSATHCAGNWFRQLILCQYFAVVVFYLLSHAHLFVTPWTVAHQATLSMGFSRQEYRSVWPCPSPGDLPNPGIKPVSPTVQEDSLPLSHLGSPWQQFCQVEKPRTSRERDAGGRKKNHRATEPLIIDSVCLSHSPCVFLLRNFDSLWKVWCLQGTFVLSACPREKLKCCIQRMINNYLLLPMLREKIPLLNLQFLLHY